MKMIIFCDLPMKEESELHSLHYTVAGNSTIEYDGKVRFPVNSVLARTMKSGEKVKVVLLPKDGAKGTAGKSVQLFKNELDAINEKIGANIEYVALTTPFEETKDVHESLLRAMVGELEEGVEIIGDVTYGPKPLPIIMFSVFKFAEKFFNAEIKNIVYGKVDFIPGKEVPQNPILYDLTPLYYLNSVTDSMECSTAEEAVKALDILLDL